MLSPMYVHVALGMFVVAEPNVQETFVTAGTAVRASSSRTELTSRFHEAEESPDPVFARSAVVSQAESAA